MAIAKAKAPPGSKVALIAGITATSVAAVTIVSTIIALALLRRRRRRHALKAGATAAVAGEHSEEYCPEVFDERLPSIPTVCSSRILIYVLLSPAGARVSSSRV